MKNYRLIKEYPGSPKLGNIIDNLENDWIENYPEFWEEVVEKNYEILFVITNNNKFIEKVYNQDATIEPYWKIHSVKRLSDGEIFTIGDIVKCEDGVDIFAGMSFYYVCEELELYNTICCTDEKIYKNAKQFSTREKAEEYIVNNIPIISLNDFHKICNDYSKPRGIDERLKEFVISKLKQSSFSC